MTNWSAQKRLPMGPGAPSEAAQACDVTIANDKGLHARASARFAECAAQFDADISVTKDALTVSATSIMGLLMLAASKGSTLTLTAEGSEAAEALEALADLVGSRFGEPT